MGLETLNSLARQSRQPDIRTLEQLAEAKVLPDEGSNTYGQDLLKEKALSIYYKYRDTFEAEMFDEPIMDKLFEFANTIPAEDPNRFDIIEVATYIFCVHWGVVCRLSTALMYSADDPAAKGLGQGNCHTKLYNHLICQIGIQDQKTHHYVGWGMDSIVNNGLLTLYDVGEEVIM